MPKGYAPLAVFEPGRRPLIERAESAWPGSPHLPRDSQKPTRATTFGQVMRQELVRLTAPDGHQMTFFVEGDWVPSMQHWAQVAQPRSIRGG